MLQAPLSFLPRTKTSWKTKLRRISASLASRVSISSVKTPKTPSRAPSLSSSPSLTPGSLPVARLDDYFLTSLDAYDHEPEFHMLLENQVGITVGGMNIPPPPPKKKSAGSDDFGPHIKPFCVGARKDAPISKETCFICEDALDLKLDSEKLVPLRCGDCVHEECLHATTEIRVGELAAQSHRGELRRETVFPACRGKNCFLDGCGEPVSPLEEELAAALMADAELTMKLTARLTHVAETPPPRQTSLVFGTDNRVSQYYVKEDHLLRPKSRQTRLLELDALSHFTLDLTLDSLSVAEPAVPANAGLGAEEVKNAFIKAMLRRYASFDLALLVSLGSLRLVDRLDVAFDGRRFLQLTVYLFSNFIVVGADAPHLFPVSGTCVITTPQTLVIQLAMPDNDHHHQVLRLSSPTDAIIEKWGIAISDKLLMLPVELVTSSLAVGDAKMDVILESPFSPADSIVATELVRELPSLEDELIRNGLVAYLRKLDLFSGTKPISPLKILRADDMGPHDVCASSGSDDDSDLDSDCELIQEIFNR